MGPEKEVDVRIEEENGLLALSLNKHLLGPTMYKHWKMPSSDSLTGDAQDITGSRKLSAREKQWLRAEWSGRSASGWGG